MKDILQARFMKESIRLLSNMYRLGWDERNGGNLSYIVDEAEVKECLDVSKVIRNIEIDFDASEIKGKYFLVTGTGKYFKNVEYEPEVNLGLFRIGVDGKTAELLWGYSDGGKFTSELPAHLMNHIERLKIDPEHRVVIHCHSTNTLAMTYVHSLSEKEFTKTLWQMSTECIVVFPDGLGILPWMLCGTKEIGYATAEKMKDYRVCIWAAHGIFGTGKTLDETFGLIETVEKSSEIYIKTMTMPRLNTISDENLLILAKAFKVDNQIKKDWLKV